ADFLPLLGPALVRVGNTAGFLVEVIPLTFAIGLNSEVHGDNRGIAKVGRAQCLRIPRPDALQEMLPQSTCVVTRLFGSKFLALKPHVTAWGRWATLESVLLRSDNEPIVGFARKPDIAGVPSDDLAQLDVVTHGGRDEHLATFVVVGNDRRYVR